MSFTKSIVQFVDDTLIDLGRQFRWTYLPPLMVYVAAGISGLTGIVGIFFIKDYLNLSAAFLAGLGFWADLLVYQIEIVKKFPSPGRCGPTGIILVAPSERRIPVPPNATCIICRAKSQFG